MKLLSVKWGCWKSKQDKVEAGVCWKGGGPWWRQWSRSSCALSNIILNYTNTAQTHTLIHTDQNKFTLHLILCQSNIILNVHRHTLYTLNKISSLYISSCARATSFYTAQTRHKHVHTDQNKFTIHFILCRSNIIPHCTNTHLIHTDQNKFTIPFILC